MISSLQMKMLRTTGETTEAGAGEGSKGKEKRADIQNEVMEERKPVQVKSEMQIALTACK